MKEITDISGHPRSFVAAYAKDQTNEWLRSVVELAKSSGAGTEVTLTREMVKDTFTDFADHIYDWVMQDSLKPMTDAQYSILIDLFERSKAKPELIKRIEGHCKTYNIKEASAAIQLLMDGGSLPLEYQDGVSYAQKDIMQATKQRADREP